jgi:hypothetical protein
VTPKVKTSSSPSSESLTVFVTRVAAALSMRSKRTCTGGALVMRSRIGWPRNETSRVSPSA